MRLFGCDFVVRSQGRGFNIRVALSSCSHFQLPYSRHTTIHLQYPDQGCQLPDRQFGVLQVCPWLSKTKGTLSILLEYPKITLSKNPPPQRSCCQQHHALQTPQLSLTGNPQLHFTPTRPQDSYTPPQTAPDSMPRPASGPSARPSSGRSESPRPAAR